MLNHADKLWNELERVTQRQLLFRTGGVFIGAQSSRIVSGSIQTAMRGNIEHEIWSTSTIRKHLAEFNIADGMRAVYEPQAYAISACDARVGMLSEAVKHGAVTTFGDTVANLENSKSGVIVTTENGDIYFARSVIITAGPWIAAHLMQELADYIDPRQVPIYWFKPKKHAEKSFSHEHFPVFLYERDDGGLLYGVPSITSSEPGVKIGFHNRQQTPALPVWKHAPVLESHIKDIASIVENTFPNLEPTPLQARHCFYTISRDESFLIGKSKSVKSAYFASACSGHGFKFAPAIGDALANMALGQESGFSLSAFSANRFDSTSL